MVDANCWLGPFLGLLTGILMYSPCDLGFLSLWWLGSKGKEKERERDRRSEWRGGEKRGEKGGGEEGNGEGKGREREGRKGKERRERQWNLAFIN